MKKEKNKMETWKLIFLIAMFWALTGTWSVAFFNDVLKGERKLSRRSSLYILIAGPLSIVLLILVAIAVTVYPELGDIKIVKKR